MNRVYYRWRKRSTKFNLEGDGDASGSRKSEKWNASEKEEQVYCAAACVCVCVAMSFCLSCIQRATASINMGGPARPVSAYLLQSKRQNKLKKKKCEYQIQREMRTEHFLDRLMLVRFFDCRFYEYKIADAWNLVLSLRILSFFFLPLVSNIFSVSNACDEREAACWRVCVGRSFFFVKWNVAKLIWLGSKLE